jgi:hypothetical protein
MNFPDLTITGFGALDSSGIHSNSGSVLWDDDQSGPADVKRSQILSRPYPGFGKLCLPDRLAFSASSLALAQATSLDGSATGIACAIPSGSFSTDRAYWESVLSGTPSPALFSATLPSSAISDIAIFFGIKGPDRVIAGTDSSAMSALETAIIMLANGKCDTALIIIVLEDLENNQHQSGVCKSRSCWTLALFCALSERFPGTCTLQWKTSDTVTDSRIVHAPAPFPTILTSLLRKEGCTIPVSEPGFKGYITVRFEGIDHHTNKTDTLYV